MKRKRFGAAIGCVACLFALTALPVLAQEGESSPADSPTGWIFRWLNFAIVFGAIAYCAVKKGGRYFRSHADEIARKIEEGARAREAAERRRKEIEAKLANLPSEVEQMRAEAKRGGEAEAQRIRAMARQEAEKIEQSAQAEIRAAERAARLELKAVAARMAVVNAQEVLESQLTREAEAGLFRTFVADLREGASGSLN
jgi:F-type H+-transporting ATPase subunit b